MWWYICTGPWRPYANFFVEYPAIEPRLLRGAMAYKYQPGGFLYYSVAKWPQYSNEWSPLLPENNYLNVPITSGPYTDWFPKSGGSGTGNNGDGSLFCAAEDGPIPTIRSENIRDGLEDYEYLKRLEDLVATISEVSEPTSEQLAWLSSAQQLLAVPSTIVSSLTSFTRDTAALENYRQQLGEAIVTGQGLVTDHLAPADHDQDGDVDLSDFGSFQVCLAGSEIQQTDPDCLWTDLNNDGYSDEADLTQFVGCISGSDIPADPGCTQ